MGNNDMQLLPERSVAFGNVVAKWAARNAASVAVSAALAFGLVPFAAEFADVAQAVAAGQDAGAQAASSAQSTAVFEKSEVVYADLDATGAPSAAYVVNRFDVEEPGVVVDFGEYDLTKNLTTTDGLSFDEGACAIELDAGTFYYQGNMSDFQLPWNVSVEYMLDGESVEAEELAGKSGRIDIRVSTSRNPRVDPAFFDSFMLQATFTLDGSKCSHIQADGATMASAGADQTAAFTVLPGHDGDFSIGMDAEDFEMAGMQIAALPYSSPVEVPDTSGMTDGMQRLADGVSDLAGGSGALAGSGAELAAGADALSSGVSQIAEGASGLDAAGRSVSEGAEAIGDGISQQADGLLQLQALLSSIDTTGMDPAVAAKIEAAKAALGKASEGMSALDGQYSAYEDGVAKYVEGVGSVTSGVARLQPGADRLSSGLKSYVSGMDELDGGIQSLDGETSKLPSTMRSEIDGMMSEFEFPEFDPVSFVSAQNQNVKSVQFVMTTPDIAVEKEPEPVEPEPEETFVDRLLNLFR